MDADKENRPNAKSSSGSYQQPWIEKYRPQKLEDVVGNEETLIRLQAIANDGNLPNLILCGPPGTGKVRKIQSEIHIYSKSLSLIIILEFILLSRRLRFTHSLVSCWVALTKMGYWN